MKPQRRYTLSNKRSRSKQSMVISSSYINIKSFSKIYLFISDGLQFKSLLFCSYSKGCIEESILKQPVKFIQVSFLDYSPPPTELNVLFFKNN